MLNQVLNLVRPGILCALFSCYWVALGASPVSCTSEPPLIATLNPSTFQAGDLIAISFDWGTASQPVAAAAVHEFTYDCEGFAIDDESDFEISLEGSWIGTASQVQTEIWTSEEGRKLHLRLTRLDGVAVGGFGFAVQASDVGVLIVDINDRLQAAASSWELALYPNPIQDMLIVSPQDNETAYSLSLTTLSGKVMWQRTEQYGPQKHALSGMAAGVYVLHSQSQRGTFTRKLIIQ